MPVAVCPFVQEQSGGGAKLMQPDRRCVARPMAQVSQQTITINNLRFYSSQASLLTAEFKLPSGEPRWSH